MYCQFKNTTENHAQLIAFKAQHELLYDQNINLANRMSKSIPPDKYFEIIRIAYLHLTICKTFQTILNEGQIQKDILLNLLNNASLEQSLLFFLMKAFDNPKTDLTKSVPTYTPSHQSARNVSDLARSITARLSHLRVGFRHGSSPMEASSSSCESLTKRI